MLQHHFIEDKLCRLHCLEPAAIQRFACLHIIESY